MSIYHEETTGNFSRHTPNVHTDWREAGRPASIAWITDELLQYTREVWSKVYGCSVSEEEAIEMLLNVKRLAGVMWKASREKEVKEDERRDLGEGVVPGTTGRLLD